MSDDPARPRDTAPLEQIVVEVTEKFRTFGGGIAKDDDNPISLAMRNAAPMFALGVDVREVVTFIAERLQGEAARDPGLRARTHNPATGRCTRCDYAEADGHAPTCIHYDFWRAQHVAAGAPAQEEPVTMGIAKLLFDPACQDLAEHFLRDEPFTRHTSLLHMDRVRSLSQSIQVAVEDWFAACPLPDPPRVSTPPEE